MDIFPLRAYRDLTDALGQLEAAFGLEPVIWSRDEDGAVTGGAVAHIARARAVPRSSTSSTTSLARAGTRATARATAKATVDVRLGADRALTYDAPSSASRRSSSRRSASSWTSATARR